MRVLRRRLRSTVIALTAVALAGFAAATPALAVVRNNPVPLATWGVWKTCGSTSTENCAQVRATAEDSTTQILYAVGDFTEAIDDVDASSLQYNDLVAIDETTGAVVSSFAAHKFNGRIYAVAVDASTNRVYVSGDFSSIDGSGTHAQHVAAFDGATGQLLSLNVRANGSVRALLLANGMLYLGGLFTSIQSTPRGELAAVDPASGALLTSFVPPTITWSGSNAPDVRTLALGADAAGAASVYVGGHFDTADGAAHMSVIRVDPNTGALDSTFTPGPFDVTSDDPLQAADQIAWVDGAQDGTSGIVVAQAGHTNRAYRFDVTGTRLWYMIPNGDVQTVALSGSTVYVGGHFTCVATAPASCYSTGGVTRIHLAAADLTTGAIDATFKPRMDPSSAPYFYGVWSLEVTADRTLWAGGVFKDVTVNSTAYPRPKLAAFPPL